MAKSLVLLCAIVLSIAAAAQERTVTGKVNGNDGLPIPGVNVAVKGVAGGGTVTDSNGKYSLSVSDGDVLTFSFIGMISKDILVGAQSVIDITMDEDVKQLEEVIVTSYGLADKSTYSGSAVTIGQSQLAQRTLTNASNALVGTVAGVQTAAGAGQPGSAPEIRGRGFSSINNNSGPLYVVDGAPYDQEINNLNPSDIESFTVLKDAAATSLYGSRAANGVIMITTKRGDKNKSSLNIKLETGISDRAMKEYERLSPSEYYTAMWESYRNSLMSRTTNPLSQANASVRASEDIGGLLKYNPFDIAAAQLVSTDGVFNPNANLRYDDLDWQKEMTRSGQKQDYAINYSGGTQNTDYFVSLGYTDDKGYVINSDFNRWTARLNVNTQALKNIKTGLNVSTSVPQSNNAATSSSTTFVNPFFFTRVMGPVYPVFQHDPVTGAYVLDADGNKIYDLGARPRGAKPQRHAIQEAVLNKDMSNQTVTGGRLFAEASFLKYFQFRVNVNADLKTRYRTIYENEIVGDGAPGGRASRASINDRSFTINQLLTFNKSHGKHSVSALAGHESYKFTRDYLYASKARQALAGNTELDNFSALTNTRSNQKSEAIESYLARVEYNYESKYFLMSAVRRDGSSRFYKDVRWGNFYSFGASWRMDKENFLKSANWVDLIKFRTSYGETGNRDIRNPPSSGDTDNRDLGDFFPGQGLYSLGYNNVNAPGYIRSNLLNNELKWERNGQWDAGVDYAFWNNRINGSIEYYLRTSKDLLFEMPLPLSAGSPKGTINKNIAQVSNQGIDIQVAVDVVRRKNFNWNINFNVSKFANRIDDLPVQEFVKDTKKWTEGKSIYDFWLRDYQGVNPANGDPLYRFESAGNTLGTRELITENKDTLTNDYNRAKYHFAGSSVPKAYGGITNTFRHKNITLSILTAYQWGGKVFDNGYQILMGQTSAYGRAMHKDALKSWHNPGDVTANPRLDIGNANNTSNDSDRWLIDASYLNLRQITLSYNFPNELLKRIGVKSSALYITSENIAFWSRRQGLNPSQEFTGVTSNVYIPARTFSVGINAGF